MKQGELFKDLGFRLTENEKNDPPRENPEEKFELRFTVDKVIFIALAGLILLIVIFSFGVEHGRKLEQEISQNRHDIESLTNLARVTAAKKALVQKKKEEAGRFDKEFSALEEETEGAPPAITPPQKPKRKFKISFPFFKSTPRETPAGAPSIVPQPLALPSVAVLLPSQNPASAPLGTKTPASPEPKVEVKTPPALPIPVVTGGYEVRILSVVDKKNADVEIEKLAKKGIQATVRKSGSYYLVALGPYGAREEAEASLKKVKSSGPFHDAYIRKLA
jgi:cell division protein FtsN